MNNDETGTERESLHDRAADTPSDAVAAPDGGARRRRWLPASIAAAVIVAAAGGSGAYLAASGSGPAAGGAGSPRPNSLVLDAAPPHGAAGGSAASGPRTAYHLKTSPPAAPKTARTAAVHAPADPRGEAARLARRLGVPGDPVHRGSAWQVGAPGAARVSVPAEPGQGWTYLKKSPGGMHPGGTAAHAPGGTSAALPGPGSTSGAGKPVPARTALDAAKPLLRKLGLTGAPLRTEPDPDGGRRVLAGPRFDGAPVEGRDTEVLVTADGVAEAHGPLGTPRASGPSWPVVTAKKALDGLAHDPAAGPCRGRGGGASRAARPDAGGGAPSAVLRACHVPSSLDVTAARFGSTLRWSRGKPVLVPAWLFTVSAPGSHETSVLARVAVAERYVERRTADPSPSGSLPSGSGPVATRTVAPTGYTADGRTLTVHGWGGVCQKYTAHADTSSGKVRVTVTETSRKKAVCPDLAKEWTLTVRLDEPLGHRAVVDASTGRAVHRAKG